MHNHSMKRKALPTIWQVSDELWARIAPILAELDPPKPTGRKRINARAALDAILFRLRSGCQWNQLPKRQFWLISGPREPGLLAYCHQPKKPSLRVTPEVLALLGH